MSDERFAVLYGVLNDTLFLCNSIFKRDHVKTQNPGEARFAKASFTLFLASCKFAESVRILLERDQPEAAHGLCRPLVEALISLKYLAKEDRDARARLFFAKQIINWEKFRRACNRREDLKDWLPADTKSQIEASFQAIQNNFGTERVKKMYAWSGSWNEMNFADMADKVDLGSLHTIGHRNASFALHLNDASSYLDVDPNDPEPIIPKLDPSPQSRQMAAACAAITFQKIVEHMNEVFALGLTEELTQLFNRLASVKVSA